MFYAGPSMADVEIFKNFTDTVNVQSLRGSFVLLDHPAGKKAISTHIREQMKKFGAFINNLNFSRKIFFVLVTYPVKISRALGKNIFVLKKTQ